MEIDAHGIPGAEIRLIMKRLALATGVLLVLNGATGVDAATIRITPKRDTATSESLDVECTGKKQKEFSGVLFTVSPINRTITIKNDRDTRTMKIAANCEITVPGKKSATLLDLKLGEPVTGRYFTTKQDTEVACSIVLGSGAAEKQKSK